MIPYFLIKPVNYILSILFIIFGSLDLIGFIELDIFVYLITTFFLVLNVSLEIYVESVNGKSYAQIENFAQQQGYNQLVEVSEFYLELYPELNISFDMAGMTFNFHIPAVLSLPKLGTYNYFEATVNGTQYLVALSSYDFTLFLAYKS